MAELQGLVQIFPPTNSALEVYRPTLWTDVILGAVNAGPSEFGVHPCAEAKLRELEKKVV